MRIFGVVFILMMSLSACTINHQPMINLRGDIQNCDSYGFHVVGYFMAKKMFNDCIDSYKKLGFVEFNQDVGLTGIIFDTDYTRNNGFKIIKINNSSSAKEFDIRVGDYIYRVGIVQVKEPLQLLSLLVSSDREYVDITIKRGENTYDYCLKRKPLVELINGQ